MRKSSCVFKYLAEHVFLPIIGFFLLLLCLFSRGSLSLFSPSLRPFRFPFAKGEVEIVNHANIKSTLGRRRGKKI